MGPYEIKNSNGDKYSVSFEVWLLHQVWQNPKFDTYGHSKLRALGGGGSCYTRRAPI
jgi:hypothetical protein